jgi:hypothetical protein
LVIATKENNVTKRQKTILKRLDSQITMVSQAEANARTTIAPQADYGAILEMIEKQRVAEAQTIGKKKAVCK